jgi:hypothetical protein
MKDKGTIFFLKMAKVCFLANVCKKCVSLYNEKRKIITIG